MFKKKKISVVFGTRPEAIKLAPVIRALRAEADLYSVEVVSTGQHDVMLEQMLRFFKLEVDHQLNLMDSQFGLGGLVGDGVREISKILSRAQPDLVLVQGDTASAFSAALAGFLERIPVAHVEAGLRTNDLAQPFPEEGMRQLVDRISSMYFAATSQNRQNLISEGLSAEQITVTGNTGIDALRIALEQELEVPSRLKEFFGRAERRILLTAHRRENLGDGLVSICQAVLDICRQSPETSVLFPVHLNPEVRNTVYGILDDHSQVFLSEPLEYGHLCWVLQNVDLVLTDSGGIQEEAPSLGKPVLVLREKTERQEGVEAGCAKLVGCQRELISQSVLDLFNCEKLYQEMAEVRNPYGDGYASSRIVEVITRKLFPEISEPLRANS